MKKRIMKWIDQQYKTPTGLLGVYFGEKMVLQHRIETMWTLQLLRLIEGEHILELGCGAGYAVKKALCDASVKTIVGYDISPTALKSAKFRNRSAVKLGRAAFILGNVNRLPFQNEMYTKIYSIQSVYFWDSLDDTVSEAYRVLKDKGSFTITLSDGKDEIPWTSIQKLLYQELIPIMKDVGFKNVDLKRGPQSRGYHTVAVVGDK